jgi:hypothetical protein
MTRIVRAAAAPALLAASAAALLSCSDSVLDTAPIGELNSITFYQTERDFEAASLSPYSTLLNLHFDQSGRGVFNAFLMPDDDARTNHAAGGDPRDIEEFNWRANNGTFAYVWEEAYKGIMRSNLILERLPEAKRFGDEKQKPRFEAEAKFIRAYFYFMLARNFGEVPLVTTVIKDVEAARVGNSKPGEVWDLVEADLDFAAKNLPEKWDNNNVGRATRHAAAALLGKVRLFRAQWFKTPAKYQEAVQALNQVVSSGAFSLLPNFGDNFLEARENNAESVFEIQMTRGDFNPWLPTDFPGNVGAAGTARVVVSAASCGPTNVCAPGANSFGYGNFHITPSLQAEFEPGDPRRFFTFFARGEDYAGRPYDPAWSVTGATPAKYLRTFKAEGFPPNISTNNERVLRYSDVLLMLAEAELLGNGNVARAAALVNQVRARARASYSAVTSGPPPANLLPDVPATGAAQAWFRTHLVHERRVELALELHRYDDLVRWHRAGLINIKTSVDFGNTVAQQNWSEIHLLKPVPQGELEVNPNLKQNTGY